MSSVRFFTAVEMIAASSAAISDYLWPFVLGGSLTLGAGLLLTVCLMTPPPDNLIDGHVLADREEQEQLAKRMIAA